MEFNLDNHTLSAKSAVRGLVSGTFFKNQTKLIWISDSNEIVITFGCLICGTQAKSSQAVGYHIGKVHNKSVGKKEKSDTKSLVEFAKAFQKLERERDKYKAEAKEAQRKLRALSRAFNLSI